MAATLPDMAPPDDSLTSESFTVPTSALDPLGSSGQGVTENGKAPRERRVIAIDPRATLAIVLVVVGVVLALVTAYAVSLIALGATASVLSLVLGLALAYEGD